MTRTTGAVPVWFGRNHQDKQHLEQWSDAPLTYSPSQPLNSNWFIDHYEVILERYDPTGACFQHAANLIMRNRFYPPQVMQITADYQLEDRDVQVGDGVLQRIRILQAWNKPVLEVLTLNKITEVVDEPRQKGFTYTTTTVHSEVGEWSPTVEWRENGEVVLLIDVVSRSRPGASVLMQRWTRWLQLRAHRLSIENFLTQLRGEYPHNQTTSEFVPAAVLPVGMLALAAVLFMGAVYNFNHKKD